ncbi:MAG: hypothetical protein AAB468_02205 [Patescibacteria group bacterium]
MRARSKMGQAKHNSKKSGERLAVKRAISEATRHVQIRRQINDGSYETPEKLQVVIDHLHDKLST